MFNFFAQIFGYVLNFLYNLVNNYGIAMILFTVIIKLLMLPLSIKQQKTMQASSKMQEEIKKIQFKYKNDQIKQNEAIMRLYKEKKMSPFSGCLTSILQIIIILSIFYLVSSPITYMKHIDLGDKRTNPLGEPLKTYTEQIAENGGTVGNRAYIEIDLIRNYQLLKEKNPEDEKVDQFNINMNFLGLDLSKIPQQNMKDYTVYIIPVLYIITTFISMRITMSMQEKQMNAKKEKEVIDITEDEKDDKEKEEDPMEAMMQTNKMMSWMMPIISISIAFIAPLGLALYWLVSNILMIIERLILNKVIKTEEE